MARTFRPVSESLEGRALLSTMIAESEPNSRPGRADVVKLEDSQVSVKGKTSASDRDFFVVPVSQTGNIDVLFQVRGKTRVGLTITDDAGRTLFNGAARRGVTTANLAAQAGTTLSVRIVGLNGRVTPYLLNLSPSKPDAPVVISKPKPEPVGPPVSGFDANGQLQFSGTLANGSDVNTHTFVVPRSGRLTVGTSRNSARVIVDVLDASGNRKLTIFSDIPNLVTSTDVEAGQTYSIRVKPQTSEGGAYDVSLSLE